MHPFWKHAPVLAGCLALGLAGAIIVAQQPNAPAPNIRSAGTSDDPFVSELPPVNIAPPVNAVPPPPPPKLQKGEVTVSGKDNAGDNQNSGKSVKLPAGTYRITQSSGCYQPLTKGKWTSADLRVSYPNRDRLGTPVGIAWPNRGEFRNEQDCVSAYRNATRTIHHGGGPVLFWIADTNRKDNAGKIALRYEQLDGPTKIAATLTCNAKTVQKSGVIEVRGQATGLAETPVAVALPTGGAAPVRFLVTTDRDGKFTLRIPVVSHPTSTLVVEALWPAPAASIASSSAPCAIPISGTASGFRASSGFMYSRIGTPERPIFSPDDALASTLVRIRFSKTPPMGMEIGRLEYDKNPMSIATPKRAIRFVRVVTDADLAFVQSGLIKFVVPKKDLSAIKADATDFGIAKFDSQRRTWQPLMTKLTVSVDARSSSVSTGTGTFETTVDATDLRDTTFALMANR